MKAGFYPRLALLGIRKNGRLYVPYLLSCAFMAAVLYVIAYLASTPALYVVNGKINGAGTTTVELVMNLGSFVVSVFTALFLLYTNSFLLRRRKKEFGLYSVLGMDRGALGSVLFWETLMAASFTLVFGLFFGVLLSYVSQAALLRLLSLPAVAFSVSISAVKQCALTFAVIFALLYLRGVLSLRHAQGAQKIVKKREDDPQQEGGKEPLRLQGEREAHRLSPRKGARGIRRGPRARPRRRASRCARPRAARRRPG